MKFKKMEINGFKSFADKTEIRFGNGVTGIVGPNGCGKSNVADSIRFALGEQSSKTLRGGNMQDVIFNGTEKRKSQSFCEVALYFDNSERIFKDLNYDEVVFSRKLFRSNESEYMINKVPCRRSDIIDALRDSGVGKEGYSIIGQGKIDELISSKPEDRRGIFDEAAGISKFKAKKTESERRLERERMHLANVNIQLEEKGKLLAPLSRQAQAARKYLELSEELKHYEINIYLHQHDSTTETKNTITKRRDEILEDMKRCQQERDNAVAEYNRAMEELGNTDKIISVHHEELNALLLEMGRNSGEAQSYNTSIAYLNDRNESLRSEIAKYEKDISDIEEWIKQATEDKTADSQALADLKVSAENALKEKEALDERISQTEGEGKKGQRNLFEAIEKLTDIKANMSKLLTEKSGLEAQITSLSEKTTQSSNANDVRRRTAEQLKKSLDESKAKLDEINKKLSADSTRNNENLARLSLNNSQLNDIRAKYYAMNERKNILSKLQNENGNFERSVAKLLDASKSNGELSSRIEGVVAKIIQVPKKYENAIEMALGGAVQNIITKTEDEAEYIINFLKAKNFGRVTFLPMNVIKPRSIHDDYMRYLNVNGCFGVASNLVSYEPRFDNIVRNLLGATVVVSDIGTGISLARATKYAFKIVTLDGDVINPHGAITGGSKKADVANVFAYDRELREMAEQLEGVSDKVQALESEHKKITKEQDALSLEIKSLSSQQHSLDVKIAAEEQQYGKYVAEIQEIDREIAESEATILGWQTRINEIDGDINSVGELEAIIQAQKADATTAGEQNESEIEEMKVRRDELQREWTTARLRIADLENKISNANKDCNRLSENKINALARIEECKNSIAENERDIENKREELERLTAAVTDTDKNKVAAIKQKIADFGGYKQKIQNDIAKYEELRNTLTAEFESLTERRADEELKLQKVDTDLELMQQRIYENYGLEYDDCLPFRTEDFNVELGIEEAAKLRRRIDNLGHINLDAVEQCEALYKEYNDLQVQRDDIVNAERDLVNIISDLSKKMKSTFSEKFNQINDNFKVIFKELFNGGTAELVLLEPDEGKDELSAGVEIKAQPPQKKLQLLSLLSGGEKALTAIAILFSILKLRPMPFCVLDEIEAALDDANALRFAKYLKRYSQETQFIVITHRKPTMELADALYGVTMEEKGVSKMVSVKLSDAVRLAE